MKTLVVENGRVLVRQNEEKTIVRAVYKSRNRFANATVSCPCCGAMLLYADLCRQLYQKQKREKYDRALLLEIIREHKSIRTGELAQEYEQRTDTPMPNRMLGYIIADFVEQGKVRTEIVNRGRYGRIKIITFNLSEVAEK
jgi:L-rhamnose isomerase